ncbi:MAG: hypothetical protein AAFR75_09405, partial [Pseudomonadota bacterium]
MGCEADVWCTLLDLLFGQAFVVNGFSETVKDEFGAARGFVGQHFEKLVALAGFSFGIWKWWVYRETILHKRLEEYLAREERRLDQAHKAVISAITTPGIEGPASTPLYATPSLRRIFKRLNWEPALNFSGIEQVVDRDVANSLHEIRRLLDIDDKRTQLLREQQMQAFSIKGAIASARATRQQNLINRNQLDQAALDAFRSAQGVPGHSRNLWLKEAVAHQLRRTGQLEKALTAYTELEALLEDWGTDRLHALLLARSKWCRAQIYQTIRIAQFERQEANSERSGFARRLLTTANPTRLDYPGVIALRNANAPYADWEAIE